MASHQDLQELLRVIAARKVPMMTAMSQVKALQAVNLRSIQQIADAEPDVIEDALGDAKTAKAIQSACKAHLKKPNTKRAGGSLSRSNDGKRPRTEKPTGDDASAESAQQDADSLEDSLALPVVTDENEIAGTSVHTNRAPLMLAFAVELLRFTMPEQPLSSRLSLAQAVVSANSRSKAVSLGLANAQAEDGSWGEGQPKVTVMGRSITVLKRGDYHTQQEGDTTAATTTATSTQQKQSSTTTKSSPWTTSSQITFKSSTFVARVANLEHPSEATSLIRSLLSSEPHLQTASHNAWGYRVNRAVPGGGETGDVREACEDDGESGCGEFILRLMRESGVANAVVVLTRWFGGEMLGPDRWRLMRTCVTEALSERLRLPRGEVAHDGVALWALDLQSMSNNSMGKSSQSRSRNDWNQTIVGAATHRPESARAYLLKSFPSEDEAGEQPEEGNKPKSRSKKTSKSDLEAEKLQNLGRLLGALRLLYESWASHLTPVEMDRRAWTWTNSAKPHPTPPAPPPPPPPPRPVPVSNPAPRTKDLETAADLFKQRKIPIIGAGIVALSLGVYVSLLVSSSLSQKCRASEHGDATPTGRPAVFTKEGARKFDDSLDGSERMMGITSLRQKLAAEATGHVLEVAMGTGRNLSFYDWSRVVQRDLVPEDKNAPGKPASAPMLSFTGVDISDEMLGLAIEKLPAAVPELKGKEPIVQAQKSSTQGDVGVFSYLSDRLRFLRSDIHDLIPAPSAGPGKYDTVVQTFGLCSVEKPEKVVQNLASVVKPDTGKIILLEHGRGWLGVLNGLLDWSAASHFEKYGCWWNRDIAQIVEDAAKITPGLEVVKIERPGWTQLGTTLWIELRVKSISGP
ncbi:hypothetical protein CkaCkLH20_06433 [Colletotrichum karsti]|uniref:Impact N-terminal domain-containing protein n=1 Tax=Colletotrichum karsti TaxID=1095194 RepID=A0A9P6LKX1_9PEZI|nr:uncharacterized protein CkaCkLH20_06433 [Colletotrichum karsti]KAF9875987.1 hypothetical protein CkaCkLH20_06433 [Colletotrichum karsti]